MEKYHCPTIIIKIVRTKGKAGYLVWKSAGGQGDHDMSLPWSCLIDFDFFVFDATKLSVENPLFIIPFENFILIKIEQNSVMRHELNFFYLVKIKNKSYWNYVVI